MHKRFLLFCLMMLAAGAAYAGHLSLFRRLCLDELVPLIDEPRIKVPVGCEVVDCCPGCPGPPIDWEILVSDPVVLTFQGLQPEVQQRLRLEGNAKWTGPTTLSLDPGRSKVNGFPADADNPPVADVKFVTDKARLAAQKPAGTADTGVRFEVRQRLGDITVNETVARISAFPCFYPVGDRLRLDNNAGSDNSVALLDARRSSGCVNDEPSHLVTSKDVGSVLSNGACNSEVAVFSVDDAMQLKTAVSTWTNPLGDITPVNLTPDVRNTPLSVWVMRGTFAATSGRVTTDRARATQLYNGLGVGTIVSVASLHDATGDPDTAGLLNAACGSAANLRSRIGFDAGRLNVYYLNDPGARGWWCGTNTIIIGSGADNESLAHEIGHAFSLGHSNGLAGIPNTNLMITGGTGRNSITKGQAFRCNINASSTMNTNGTRTGTTRNCPDATSSATCPALALNP